MDKSVVITESEIIETYRQAGDSGSIWSGNKFNIFHIHALKEYLILNNKATNAHE
jgi:hypothetical protein